MIMIYQVDMSKFSVEKQEQTWLCWAATAKAVTEYLGVMSPDQQGFAQLFPNKAMGADPTEALKTKGITASQLIHWKTKPDAGDVQGRIDDLKDNLKYHLDARSGPMLCGLQEANDQKWTINVASGGTKSIIFKHATLLFRYDDVANKIWLADPARSDAKGREFTVTPEELVEGFVYCKTNELGPNAQQIVPPGLTDIRVRLYRLDEFSK
jgi:hypothetical protein